MKDKLKKEIPVIAVCGLIIGVIAVGLVHFGNPANMGFCIACFLRDTAGALNLHTAGVVQYIRPEIIGLVLGSFILALIRKEFSPKGGSAPLTRFVLGFFVMVGCLMFLGCPFRMILRLAAGDLNALIGLVGFILGICVGIFFLKKGFSLGRTHKQPLTEGIALPITQVILLILVIAAPAFIAFSEGGPGSKHAPIWLSLIAGLAVGAMAQHTRLCMVGGIRDIILFREKKLLIAFVAIFVSALICNLTFGKFNLSFEQPGMIAFNNITWNLLGMFLAGYACVLLGGCPLRQLVLAGEGNSDSAVTVLGLVVGAAFCHNFKLASAGASADSAGGPTTNGKIAVLIGIAVVTLIAVINVIRNKKKANA